MTKKQIKDYFKKHLLDKNERIVDIDINDEKRIYIYTVSKNHIFWETVISWDGNDFYYIDTNMLNVYRD